jgi:hypothetical protein
MSFDRWSGGHARMETTAIYLEVSGQEERDVAERLWQVSSLACNELRL